MTFLEDWLKHGGRPPSQLGRFSVENDRWDVKRFEQMLREMRPFDAERTALCEVATETGNGLWADAFFAFNKVDPKLVEPGSMQARYLINRAVMAQAVELPEFQRLKNWTEGDAVAAAGACIAIRPDLEQLYDKTKTAQDRAKELEQKLAELAERQQEKRDLDDLIAEWSQANDPDAPENADQATDYQSQQQLIEEQLEQLTAEAEACASGVQAELDAQAGGVKAALKHAIGKAADEAEQLAASARMWGLDPGALVRMSAEERMALAKRLNKPPNGERFRRMADLFGPLERLMATEHQRRVNYVPEEVYDVGIGRDLERVLPSVLGELTHPLRRLDFYSKFIEGKLPQYELRGTEKVARGGIVICIDNSGSMEGDRELWAKAVGLVLLNLAQQQKRSFWGIHFGSASEIREFDFSRGASYTYQDVIDFAEFFFNGGTNFVKPLSLALDRVRTEFDRDGAVEADIVFVTDGMCGVPEHWKQDFMSEIKRIGTTVWGINIGGRRQDQPMFDLCGGKVATIGDVLDSSKDIRKVFSGVI